MTLATARYRGQVCLEDVPDPMTVTEAARVTGVAAGLIYAEIRSGRLYGRRIGRRILVPKHGYLRWLEGPNNEEDAQPPRPRLSVPSGGQSSGHRQQRV